MIQRPQILLLSSLLLTGCGSLGSPNCSGDDVTALVQQIAMEHLATQVLGAQIGLALRDGNNKPFELAAQYPIASYADWKDNPPIQHADMQQLVGRVEVQLAQMTIDAIRTTATDDTLKLCRCAGQLTIPDYKSLDVEYTAQYTEDGQLWVEVQGLL